MNLQYTNVIESTKPSKKHQLKLISVATFFLVILPAYMAFRLKDDGSIYQFAALAISAIGVGFIGWSIMRDREILTWRLSDSKLQQGNRSIGVSAPFTDIESIVIGLPKNSSVNYAIKYTESRGRRFTTGNEFLRNTALFIRLKGNRILILNLLSDHYKNGRAVMTEFIKLNASKVNKSTFTFTEQEYLKLRRPRYNSIIQLNP